MRIFTVTLSTKGQFVIPALIRKKLQLKDNHPLTVVEKNGTIRLRPIKKF